MLYLMNAYQCVAITVGTKQLSNSEETKSITFRLPKRILEQVELEAEQNNVSENVLVKQILTNYVDWFRLSKGIGMIPITKESIRRMSEHLDAASITGIVADISSMIENFSTIRYGKYDFSTILDSLSMYVQMSNSQLIHLREGSNHRFLINHNLGITWSLILEQLFKTMFVKFMELSQIQFKTTDDSVIASVTLTSVD